MDSLATIALPKFYNYPTVQVVFVELLLDQQLILSVYSNQQ